MDAPNPRPDALSARTVEYPLCNVFVKLGISSRAELIRVPGIDGAARASR